MGGMDYNQSFSLLGGNPGSYTYNVMFNYNPGTSWTKVYGYWNGFGSSYGSAGTGNTNNWISGTKYFTPQALFNYGLNSGIRRCYISGWKCVRVRATGNRYFRDNVLVNGNIGVGTTNPSSKLYVSGNATDNVGLAYFENTSSGGIYYPAATFINSNGNHSYGIVAGFKTGSASGTDRPSILFYSDLSAHSWSVGQVTSGWGSNDSFGIGYRASNDPNSFGNWPSNYFTITTGGNVGIGITSPGAILDVKSSVSSYNNKIATFQDAYTGSALDIKSQYSATPGSYAHMGIQAYFPGTSPMIYNNIVINGLGGNVGIGILSPDQILHINGPMRIDSALGSDPPNTTGTPRVGIGDVESDIYLADPAVWLTIYLNGTEYVIPAYYPN
jgi:hypothetical protein